MIDEDLILEPVFLERWKAETTGLLEGKPVPREPSPSAEEAGPVTWIVILVVVLVSSVVVLALAVVYCGRRKRLRVDSNFEDQLSLAISAAHVEFQKVYPGLPNAALPQFDG